MRNGRGFYPRDRARHPKATTEAIFDACAKFADTVQQIALRALRVHYYQTAWMKANYPSNSSPHR